jgi:Fe(3+) dicitrate transport protein
MFKKQVKLVFLIAGLLAINVPSYAEELSPVSVFGAQNETQQAGSAHFISDEEIKRLNYTDAERMLSSVPGVYSQTEDGYGLRANIGMRGVAPLRTTKVNIMEDGVLQGPAVYSNGSMYFFPDVGRMEGVEVLKGPAAIGTGPRTTAGTINFLSRSVPTVGSEGHYSVTLGDDGFSKNHTYYGGNIGSIGYVFEYHDYRADGFKNIKGTSNPTDTGFDKQTDLFKIRYTPQGSSWNQYFELLSSNTTETSNETYLGLTGTDFAADPYQRYGASSFDQMDNDYHRYIFTHFMQPAANISITSKLYKTRYSRLWAKGGHMYIDAEGAGSGTPVQGGFSSIEMKTNASVGAAEVAATAGAGEAKDTDAVSWHLKDVITHGSYTTTLGVRYEDTESNDGTVANPGNDKRDIKDSETMLGLSTIKALGGGTQIFAGYHQGYSPISAGDAEARLPEESDNFEIGFRMSTPSSFFEVIGFLVDYDNLHESCLTANGCTGNIGDTTNAGEAEVKGIEFQYRMADIFAAPQMKGMSNMSSMRFPLTISGLLQDSEYKTNTDSENNQMGNSIAYVPDFQFYTSLGVETNAWDVALGAKYHDDTFTNASNTHRTGKAFIFDLHGGIKLPINMGGIGEARLFLNVDNLFDKVIVASEHAYGKRPNKPLTVMTGVKIDF